MLLHLPRRLALGLLYLWGGWNGLGAPLVPPRQEQAREPPPYSPGGTTIHPVPQGNCQKCRGKGFQSVFLCRLLSLKEWPQENGPPLVSVPTQFSA